MEHEKVFNRAQHDISSSKEILDQLHANFSDVIPVDQMVNMSAANLAQMATIITEYSELRLALIKMFNAKTIRCEDKFELTGTNLDIFKFAISTVLDLVDNDVIEEVEEISLSDIQTTK